MLSASVTFSGNDDPELDAMMEIDEITIEGATYLVLCEDAMRQEYYPIWQINRQRVIENIQEIISGRDRALLRYDALEESARSGENPPYIHDPVECIGYLDNNRHEAEVAIARLREARGELSASAP